MLSAKPRQKWHRPKKRKHCLRSSRPCRGENRGAGLFRTIVAVCLALSLSAMAATTVPPNFSDSVFVDGIADGTCMEFAPDGRLFVAQQGGKLLVVKNGTVLPTPFLSVSTDTQGERGLLGLTFDPAFVSNGFLYI